jgi:hypothetical protein
MEGTRVTVVVHCSGMYCVAGIVSAVRVGCALQDYRMSLDRFSQDTSVMYWYVIREGAHCWVFADASKHKQCSAVGMHDVCAVPVMLLSSAPLTRLMTHQ